MGWAAGRLWGVDGFYEMLAALADPAHLDHKDIADWLDEYDPNTINEASLKNMLSRVADRRNAARKRPTKSAAG